MRIDAVLDTVLNVETPEGVDLELRLAGPVPRLLAWLIDFMLRLLALIGLAIPLGLFGAAGTGLFLILWFGLEWLYPVVLEVLDNGRTPGKRMLGLRVVRWDGTPLEWTSSVLRNLLRAADFLPLAHVLGLLTMLLSGSFQRLGDLAAGTVVIHDRLPDAPLRGQQARPVPPPLPLSVDEQRAVIGFAAREPALSRARAHELAALATPLAKSGDDPVLRLRGIAAWLSGARPTEGSS